MNDRQQQELADFLKQKRACLRPGDFGFSDKRRRTPGLRREEVALLSGISFDWYTWLEQARDIQASRETLQRIAQALRLEPTETRYLLEIGGFKCNPSVHSSAEFIEPSLYRIINELVCCPCIVIGRRWDLLAWNQAAKLIYGDLEKLSDLERNGLWQYFIGQTFPEILEERSQKAVKAVAIFRMERAKYLNDPFFDQLIDALTEQSEEFAQLWTGHEVDVCDPDTAHFIHPDLGRLSFEHSAYDLNDSLNRGFRLVTYVPLTGTPTKAKIANFLGNLTILNNNSVIKPQQK